MEKKTSNAYEKAAGSSKKLKIYLYSFYISKKTKNNKLL